MEESFNILRNEPTTKVQFIGKEGLPVWGITYFLENTCLNHMKLTTIRRICQLSAIGAEDWRFSVGVHSAEIFPTKNFQERNDINVIQLAEKSGDPDEFWYVLNKFKRPIVFFEIDGVKIPLYDYTYEEAARIWSFKEQSPPEGWIFGAASSLIELRYAHKRDQREIEAHINAQIEQNAINTRQIILTDLILQNPNLSPGVRFYAERNINQLMTKQDEINRKMGIIDNHIDMRF